ncbi:MAG TPA: hypothetical protein VFL78_07995 [Rhodanobacteraceae bacterium]|nr:hypothetical protein [Rhodanobacteraceae bacterium]
MQTRSLSIVLLRVVAVLVVAQGMEGVAQLGVFVLRDTHAPLPDFSFWLLLALLWPLAVGIVLWLIAPGLSIMAIKRLPPSLDTERTTAQGLAHVAFVVVGTWLLVNAIPGLVMACVQMSAPFPRPDGYSLVIELALRCIFGLGLIVGSRWMADVLLRLRYMGTNG